MSEVRQMLAHSNSPVKASGDAAAYNTSEGLPEHENEDYFGK